jgi:hypothetical protein
MRWILVGMTAVLKDAGGPLCSSRDRENLPTVVSPAQCRALFRRSNDAGQLSLMRASAMSFAVLAKSFLI